MSSPVPRVDARSGSLRRRTSASPLALRHLDHRGAVGQHPPLGLDRIAERPGDARGAARAAARREQRVERALAAVGQRELAHLVEPGASQPAAIAAAASAAAERAAELVGAHERDRLRISR